MAYVEEFRNAIATRAHSKIMQLWHEYCHGDLVDGPEIIEILQLIKQSDFGKPFGQYVEAILPLALLIQEEAVQLQALQLLFDLQTTNSEALFHVAKDLLNKQFAQVPGFTDKLRLVGMRTKDNFQGVLSNFLLLNHIEKGNFVLHTAGWGVGEIVDFSFLREQVSVEFENLQGGKRDISFKNAFKTVLPIAKTHFLAARFADPVSLEAKAKENPAEIVHHILRDLGSKTAAEIKDLLVDVVILEDEYSKWWQQARSKLKKDPLIESPDNPKQPFKLRKGLVSSEDRVTKAFVGKKNFQEILQAANSLVRDFPELLKDASLKEAITSKVKSLLVSSTLSQAELLQVLLFLDQPLGCNTQQEDLKKSIQTLQDVEAILRDIDIISLKKRLLVTIQALRTDWAEIFLKVFFTIEPNQLRDYIFKELSVPQHQKQVTKQIEFLKNHPKQHPEALLWYFQKIINQEEELYQDIENKSLFFEAFLILMSSLDFKAESRDLLKKMYGLMTNNRFELVRSYFKEASDRIVKEFLLLASKCRSFSDHDQKILRSLAEVAHPQLAKDQKQESSAHDDHIIWTTQEGYNRAHERIQRIGTVEMV